MSRKRWRAVVAKPGELRAGYGNCDGTPAINYATGGGGASKPDARVLCTALEDAPVFDGKSLAVVLAERGYDITTLKFSIKQKATP